MEGKGWYCACLLDTWDDYNGCLFGDLLEGFEAEGTGDGRNVGEGEKVVWKANGVAVAKKDYGSYI